MILSEKKFVTLAEALKLKADYRGKIVGGIYDDRLLANKKRKYRKMSDR